MEPKWQRVTLKENAKQILKRFYWQGFLVIFIFILINSIATGIATGIINVATGGKIFDISSLTSSSEGYGDYPDGYKDGYSYGYLSAECGYDFDKDAGSKFSDSSYRDGYVKGYKKGYEDSFSGNEFNDTLKKNTDEYSMEFFQEYFDVESIIYALITIFLISPLTVGIMRFYMRARTGYGKVGDLFYSFQKKYGNITFTMFIKQLYVALWSILFIIPGIIWGFAYTLVPYIMAENPNIKFSRALKISKETMKGEKWRYFVLQLSFIPWYLLGVLACGIGIYFVLPYVYATNAEFYALMRQKALSFGIANNDELVGFLKPGENFGGNGFNNYQNFNNQYGNQNYYNNNPYNQNNSNTYNNPYDQNNQYNQNNSNPYNNPYDQNNQNNSNTYNNPYDQNNQYNQNNSNQNNTDDNGTNQF